MHKASCKKITSLLFFLVLTLWNSEASIAQYVAPGDLGVPEEPSRTPDTRGDLCDEAGSQLPFMSLAHQLPNAGHTISTHPTLVWFVPGSESYLMELNLLEENRDGDDSFLDSFEMVTSPGIMNFTLPDEQIDLSIGETYIWEVVIKCNPNQPSSDLIIEAKLEIIEPSTELLDALSGARSSRERVILYAQHGVWYDAIHEAIIVEDSDLVGSLIRDLAELENSSSLRELADSL